MDDAIRRVIRYHAFGLFPLSVVGLHVVYISKEGHAVLNVDLKPRGAKR